MQEKRGYRVVIGHPGRQHSLRLATALKAGGVLEKYLTTVYFGKSRRSITRLLTRFLRGENKARAQKRVAQSLDDEDVITYYELLGLLTILAYRIDPSARLANALEGITSWLFQRSVAAYAIQHDVDAVIMYDCNARHCFEILARKAPHIVRVIDNAHPVRNYLYEIYQAHLASSGDFAKTYAREPFLKDRHIASKYGVEAKTADYHIVASSFSQASVTYNGFHQEQIIKVPYGVNSSVFVDRGRSDSQQLKVLFVGEINQRKGIAQLLGAAQRLQAADMDFTLIGGGKEFHSELYEPYEPYVTFKGRVSFEELVAAFGESDLFLFPSMGEGFGLVILEALSAGLPVICSTNCAGSDVIKDYENGFVIPAGDTEALVERLLWFRDNRDRLAEMGRMARSTALEFTWENYEQGVVAGLDRVMALRR